MAARRARPATVQNRQVFARAAFGQPFELVTASFWADLSTPFYRCGVNIP